MGMGFAELAILSWIVAITCFAPGIGLAWHRGWRLSIGSLSLLVMVLSVLVEVVRQLGRWSRNVIT